MRKPARLSIELSARSYQMLSQLAELGIFGATPQEVAARFVDGRLAEMWLAGKISAGFPNGWRKK